MGRSDDERSLSSGGSVGGDGSRSRSGTPRSRSRSNSVHSDGSNNNNNNDDDKADPSAANGGVAAAMSSGFSFFELGANAGAMPYNLETRNAGAGGVWTKTQLPKGVKYGPFLGKWGPKPVDSRFAWEVSEITYRRLVIYNIILETNTER